MTKPKPQRCVVASCGRVPVQIEHYEINNPSPGERAGAVSVPVCGGHTGIATHKGRMTGIEPIVGIVAYKDTPLKGAA
jgi:hypothetical protein